MSVHGYLEYHRKIGKQNLQLRDIEGTKNTKADIIRIVKDGKRVEKISEELRLKTPKFHDKKGKH